MSRARRTLVAICTAAALAAVCAAAAAAGTDEFARYQERELNRVP